MRLWQRGLTAMAVAGLLMTVTVGSAFAAEDRTEITSVTLTISSSIEAGDDSSDVSVTTDASTYDVEDVEVLNDEGEWVSGDVPRVEITLTADDDYYFGTMSKSKVKLKGDDATYVSSHREDSKSTLVVTVKLDELEGSMEIEEVSWETEYSPIATWEDTDGAVSYQVRLYRNSSSVGSAVTTTNEYYNFASSITREGEYYFKVRAVNSSSKKGDWYESDSYYVDEDILADIQSGRYSTTVNTSSGTTTTTSPSGTSYTAGWQKDSVGWWYRNADGTYPANGWVQIGDYWYCFDASGYMRTGWIKAGDGYWYYCSQVADSTEGRMLTSTTTPDGYYVDANGRWVS
ncbi:MAG: hypothetical protein LIO81_01145 [Clostridiales bacterium]|nr:hypothetical protein [Clostridiales bacterium]